MKTLVTSMLSALIFGLAPALDSSRHDPIEALKETRGSGARTHRLASIFVTSQIALSMVLLLVTGVLLFSSEAVKCYYSSAFWIKMI